MAYGETPLLDSFTGSDENPIATNWSGPIYTGGNQLRRTSNELTYAGSGSFGSSYYDLEQFGPNCEAWFQLVDAASANNDDISIFIRLTDVGGTPSGYRLHYFPLTDIVRITRIDDSSSTTLGADITGVAIGAGDGLGIRGIGDLISAYKWDGVEWNLLGSRTDATYAGAGYIGAGIFNASTALPITLDEFGGGTLLDSYENEVLADSPVAYYRMDEASGLIQDSSGNGNHATSVSSGTPNYQQTGPITSDENNYAIDFPNNPYFSIDDDATLDIGDTFTLEAWIYRDAAWGSTHQVICSKAPNGPSLLIGGSGAPQPGGLQLGKAGVAFVAHSGDDVPINEWVHLAISKTGSSYAFYFNGEEVVHFVDSGGTIENTASVLTIGDEDDTVPADFIIDELAIYGTVLSPARILAHYEAAFEVGAASFPPVRRRGR